MILDLSRFGDGDETEATFGDGEGSTRCTVAVVGILSDPLEFVEVGCW